MKKIAILSISILLCLFVSFTTAEAKPQHDPSILLVKEVLWIEKSIKMPAGAATIDQYTRHYAWMNNERTEIYMVLIRGRSEIHLVELEDLPAPRDGSCSVVTARILVKPRKFVDIACNSGA
jgi:hypothetical protein